jgi:O-antigen ligase
MPNGHNGYLDVKVELGYAGYALFMAFVIATLHAIGRVADRAPIRAWLILTLALQIIITNGLESIWMRGFEMLWIVFVILVAEIGRYWKPLPTRTAQPARSPKPGTRRPATPRPRFRPIEGGMPAASASAIPPTAGNT